MDPRVLIPLVALAALAACGRVSEPNPSAASTGAPQPAPGHARMVARLAALAAEADVSNPFTGTGTLEIVRGEVAALTPDTPPAERAVTLHRAGMMALDRGLYDEAIGRLAESRETVRTHAEEVGEALSLQVRFSLALTWMRLGETRNCVALHTSQSCILPIGPAGVHTDQSGSRNAIAILEELLADDPEHVPSRWVSNIAYMTLGEYPDGVPPGVLIPPERWESEEAFRHFTDVGPENGLSRTSLTGAVLVEDLTGDGRLDVMECSWDPEQSIALYPNSGGGPFVDEGAARGLAGITGGVNLRQADFDGDGDVDVFVCRGTWWGALGRHPSSLLANDGGGSFTDVAYDAGLAGDGLDYPSHAAAWADHDRDGDVDIFCANESGQGFEATSQLFRNDGDGTFTDVASAAGVENLRFAKGCAWGDVEGDGDPDLYVANFMQPNRLYLNGGDGAFADVAEERGVAGPSAATTCWFFDQDGDGDLDLFCATYRTFLENVACEYLGCETRGVSEPLHLWHGDGAGGFEEVGADLGLTRNAISQGGDFGDLDDDGRLDVYLGTGFAVYEALVPNLMLRNRGDRFADVTTAGGFGHLQKGNGVAFADIDADGDQDVLLQVGGQYTVDAFGDVLFENPGGENAWIRLRLVGATPNTAAIGAEVRVLAGSRELRRTVGFGSSHGGSPLEVHVGLGSEEGVDRVEVTWPSSGRVQVFEGLAVRRRWKLVEGEAAARAEPLRPFELLP